MTRRPNTVAQPDRQTASVQGRKVEVSEVPAATHALIARTSAEHKIDGDLLTLAAALDFVTDDGQGIPSDPAEFKQWAKKAHAELQRVPTKAVEEMLATFGRLGRESTRGTFIVEGVAGKAVPSLPKEYGYSVKYCLWRYCERFGLNPRTEIPQMEAWDVRDAIEFESLRWQEEQQAAMDAAGMRPK